MTSKLGELPCASVLVRATVLGTGVLLTTACAHQHIQQAPTCGPCCHGDPSSCYVPEPADTTEQDEQVTQDSPSPEPDLPDPDAQPSPNAQPD